MTASRGVLSQGHLSRGPTSKNVTPSWHYLSMFDIEIAADTLPHGLAPDQLEQDLITIESTIGRLRARQLRLLCRVDLAQIAARDGSRSLHEWTAARLDITAKLAADLVTASRTIPDDLDNKLTVGEMSFDRAVATSHLVVAGASERLVDDSAGFDLAGVGRLAAQHRAMTPKDEVEVFDSRHAAIHLSLDQTSANVWATLTGVDCEIVTQALDQWAEAWTSNSKTDGFSASETMSTRSRPGCADTFWPAMVAAPPTPAAAGTGYRSTTSSPVPRAAPTTPKTSPLFVGGTIMLSSTARDTRSIPTAHRSVAASNPRESTHPDHSGLLRSPTPTTTTQPPSARPRSGLGCGRPLPPSQSNAAARPWGSSVRIRNDLPDESVS